MLQNIQALRAFAALNVVLFHIIGTSAYYHQGTSILSILEGWGTNGVDIFFVISGFVMVYAQYKNPKSPMLFFKHRIIRIVPLYWLLMFFLLFLYFTFETSFRNLSPTFENSLLSFFFLSNLLGEEHPLLYLGWTLEYEMFFYVLFSVGLFFENKVISFCIPIFVLVILTATGMSNLIVLEFALGMLCAYLYLTKKWTHFVVPSFILGLTLLLSSIFIKLELDRFIVSGIPSALLVFGVVNLPQYKNKVVSLLGAASYSIYLVQVFTIPAFYKFSSISLTFIQVDILAFVALVSSAVFGCLVYLYAEKPMTHYFNKKMGNH